MTQYHILSFFARASVVGLTLVDGICVCRKSPRTVGAGPTKKQIDKSAAGDGLRGAYQTLAGAHHSRLRSPNALQDVLGRTQIAKASQSRARNSMVSTSSGEPIHLGLQT